MPCIIPQIRSTFRSAEHPNCPRTGLCQAAPLLAPRAPALTPPAFRTAQRPSTIAALAVLLAAFALVVLDDALATIAALPEGLCVSLPFRWHWHYWLHVRVLVLVHDGHGIPSEARPLEVGIPSEAWPLEVGIPSETGHDWLHVLVLVHDDHGVDDGRCWRQELIWVALEFHCNNGVGEQGHHADLSEFASDAPCPRKASMAFLDAFFELGLPDHLDHVPPVHCATIDGVWHDIVTTPPGMVLKYSDESFFELHRVHDRCTEPLRDQRVHQRLASIEGSGRDLP